jgi:hypothetical protein
MKISFLIFGQFRTFKINLESNLKNIYNSIIDGNEIDVFILTDKKIKGNYSKENLNNIIEIFKKFNCNIGFIKYWEDLKLYYEKDDLIQEQYNKECKHNKGQDKFVKRVWYRTYLLNKFKNKFSKENNKNYDLNIYIRPFDMTINPLKSNEVIKKKIKDCLVNEKLLMSIDTIFIGNNKVINKLFDFGKEHIIYHDNIWKNKKLSKYFLKIDKWLYKRKRTYCSEIQIYSYIYHNNFDFESIRYDFNNKKSPLNDKALFKVIFNY